MWDRLYFVETTRPSRNSQIRTCFSQGLVFLNDLFFSMSRWQEPDLFFLMKGRRNSAPSPGPGTSRPSTVPPFCFIGTQTTLAHTELGDSPCLRIVPSCTRHRITLSSSRLHVLGEKGGCPSLSRVTRYAQGRWNMPGETGAQ